ncbi:hypothetical protein E4K10_23245 [Streptomyces sp. T1317-0309]|nr:hypothetical protein E4K10_23245 [Streptomyces sp. T1317-0309]
MSASDPRIFENREVVVQDTSTGRSYTPRDYPNCSPTRGCRRPGRSPTTTSVLSASPTRGPSPTWMCSGTGSGLPTVVGARLPNLSAGQIAQPGRFLYRDGDGNQEDITNEAVLAWRAMACHRFGLTDNPGVDHFSLPGDRHLLDRLLAHLAQPRSDCPADG